MALQRAAKDAFFRASPDSPITWDKRAGFAGLSYYPIDPTLRFEGLRLLPRPGSLAEILHIATSDGTYRPARRVGKLEFPLDGGSRTLTAFDVGADDASVFIPFADATSVVETYASGRYLDIVPDPDGTYVLDFNAAYQPYCAYSPDYSCPLTPAENLLPDRIEAGERLALVGAR